MGEKKQTLRAAALARRNSLSRSEFLARSRLIQARALEFSPYLTRPFVALYSPIQNEVETGEIRDHALVAGKSVFFPRFGVKNALELIQIGSAMEFSRGRLNVLEPTGQSRFASEDREKLVVFVPGLAFDLRGNRLGRGQGGYDRLIKELGEATLVALAYDFQIVDEVPAEEWDQRVHYLITERSVVDCRCAPMQSSQAS
ncbi:MAG TPA: 5-formyltetrahydrofolate cyclo-ligase [Candidatus Binatia bacterium]|nr:5-formyltetrahydrofolate cyclo-ligase [Candidatus Binatia bacterium]